MISAPGKVLWIGSYAVVFGGISHVISINKRVRCDITDYERTFFETSYGSYFEDGNELISSVKKVIIDKFGFFPKVRVKLINDNEFEINNKKTGLGSSSAATVALTACIYHKITGKLDLDEIHRLAQKANFIRQKGVGSGFDIASAVYGSIIYKRFTDINKMDFYYEKLKIGKYMMILGFTGRSSNTVNLVKEFIKKQNDSRFKDAMNELNIENETAIKLLKLGKIDEACVHVDLAWNFLNFIAEDIIGIKLQSKEDKELISIAKREGAWASIMPGAGGGDIIFAIGDNLDNVKRAWEIKGIKIIEIAEDEGLKIDS